MLERVRSLAESGAYRTAWKSLHETEAGTADWLELRQFLALRLGLDTERRATLRVLRRIEPDTLRVKTVELLEDLRTGRTFRAFERARAAELPPARTADDERSWQLALARLHSHLRDFERAYAAIARAEAVAGEHPLIEIERAWTLQDEDRRLEAVQLVRASQTRWPAYGLLREQECWLLDAAGSDDALAVMTARSREFESPPLEASIAYRLFEAGETTAARAIAERTLASPPTGRPIRRALHGLLLRIARTENDDERALRHATAVKPPIQPWSDLLRAAREKPGEDRPTRVVHPVPFVRQDHLTCSPATMASLLRSFGFAIDQREIADKITYDGTPVHGEWVWAEQRGFASYFFLFDAELARELIDRGLPFAITLRAETWAHRVALAGYDRTLDTFLLRDPNQSLLQEVQRSYLDTMSVARGGVCALMLPRELASRVPEKLVEEGALWLDYLKMCHAFEERRLSEAETLADTLLARASGHLDWAVRLKLAEERRDERGLVDLAAKRLAAEPDDPVLQVFHAGALERAGRWHEHRAFLETVTSKLGVSPRLELWFADAIRQHAAERPRAERMVRSVLKRMPNHAYAFRSLADLLWSEPARRAEATEIYRAASCLAPLDEGLARSHAVACMLLGDEERGLEFLTKRVERYGVRSPEPALNFARVLREFEKPDRALQLLEQTAARHATKPAALIEWFDALLFEGRIDAAAELFARTAPLLGRLDRDLAAARLARARGDFPAVLESLRLAAAVDPPAPHAVASYWHELFVQRGIDAAREAVLALQAQHGDDPLLMMEALQFHQRAEDHTRSGALLERLVREHPHEAWLRERLAQHAYQTNDLERLARELVELERALPDSVRVATLRAQLESARGDRAAARTAIRRALALRFDNAFALRLALDLAPDPESADALLREARAKWLAEPRPPHIDGLKLWLSFAEDRFETQEIEEFLAQLRASFPTAREMRMAAIEQRLAKSSTEALADAEALVVEFPGDADVLILRARCLRKEQKFDEARATLEELIARRPSTVGAYALLGECCEDIAQLGAARAAYRRGIARVPAAAMLHGYLAEVSWKLSAHDEALAAVTRAHALDRDYAWAWDVHVQWLSVLGRPDEALAVAEECTRANPRWVLSRRLLARVYAALGRHQDHIAALQHALELQPRLGPERLRLILALIDHRRFDEARTARDAGVALLGENEDLAAIEARILRAHGELAASRAALKDVLARHDDFTSVWLLQLEWLAEEALNDEIVALASAPPAALADSSVLHGYAGDAWIAKGDPDRAITALRRALEIAPDYHWGRDRLAGLLVDKKANTEVLTLLGEDPAALTLPRASYVGCAAARLKRGDLARACFDRLLSADEVEAHHLILVDEALRQFEPRLQNRRVLEASRTGDRTQRTNAAYVLAWRRETSAFFAALDKIWKEPDRVEAERAVSRLCESAVKRLERRATSSWIAKNVHPPLADVQSLGLFAYAVACDDDHAAMTRLFGADWRRQGVRGWMLANLSYAWLELGRFGEVEAVSRFALDELPQDHSFWWHHRYLAELELRRGRPLRCLELRREPPAQMAAELLRWRVLELRAGLALAKHWFARRRVLGELLPVIRELWPRARKDGAESNDLRGWAVFRACPSFASLRYALIRSKRGG